EVDRPVVGALCAGAEEVTPQALATAAEPVELEHRHEGLLLPARVEIREAGDRFLAVEETLEGEPPVASARYAVERVDDVLAPLPDVDGGGRRPLVLRAGDRALVVLVGEVELGQADGHDRGRDDRRHDGDVLPDQTRMRRRPRRGRACALRGRLRYRYT